MTRRTMLAAAAMICVGIAPFVVTAQTKTAVVIPKRDALEQRVAELEAKVAQLSAELQMLKAQKLTIAIPPTTPNAPLIAPDWRAPKPDWQAREFNGSTVYL